MKRIIKELIGGFLLVLGSAIFMAYLFVNQLDLIINPIRSNVEDNLTQLKTAAYIESLASNMQRHDEILSQAIENYVITKDEKWKTRYQEFLPAMQDIIGKIKELDPKETDLLGHLDSATQAIMRIENEAFLAARFGDFEEAKRILKKSEYTHNKQECGNVLQEYFQRQGLETDDIFGQALQEVEKTLTFIETTGNKAKQEIILIILVATLIIIVIGTSTTKVVSKGVRAIEKTKSDFISLASHQLLTPLTSILWNTELLQDSEKSLSSKSQDTINDIYASSRSMSRLIDSFLDMSRIETGKIKPRYETVIWSDFLHELTHTHQPIASKKNVDFKIKGDENIPTTIYTDPSLLRQILNNLLSNAFRYGQEVNPIVILAIKKQSKSLFISVTDNGVGILEEDRPKLFRKLFRAENAFKKDPTGTGIGLYLCKKIITLLKGEIGYQKTADNLTQFVVRIPIIKKRP